MLNILLLLEHTLFGRWWFCGGKLSCDSNGFFTSVLIRQYLLKSNWNWKLESSSLLANMNGWIIEIEKKRVKFHGKQSANDECKEQLITLRDPLKIIQEFVGTLNSFSLFISDLSTLCGKVSSDCRYSMPLIASFINYWTALSCSSERKNRFIAQKNRMKNCIQLRSSIEECCREKEGDYRKHNWKHSDANCLWFVDCLSLWESGKRSAFEHCSSSQRQWNSFLFS